MMNSSTSKDSAKNSLLKKTAIGAAVLLFWLAVWQIAASGVGKEILLPSPLRVFSRIGEFIMTVDFWQSAGGSLLRILVGFAAGVVSGVILGFLCFRLKAVYYLFSPIMTLVRATPVASFIILALVWLSDIRVPSFTAFLMVLPIVCESSYTGFSLTDKNLAEMEQVFRFSFFKRLTTLYIPSFLPYFYSAVKTSLGLSWKAGIAAEVLCTPANSIGKRLYESKIYLETVDVFAWTAFVIILSLILEKLILLIFTKLTKRRNSK